MLCINNSFQTVVCLSLLSSLFVSPTLANEKTTIALTTTVQPKAAVEDKQLAENLLSLLEVEASQHESLQVVERQQLDIALHEQVVSNTAGEQTSLQLGKLSAAELFLTAKILKQESDKKQYLAVRITESLTGTIRGATLTPFEALTIDETAREITQYLFAVVTAPELAGVSISVAPFESLGRFDRLRSLERGLRDMAVVVLRRYAGLRVLQRSDMQQLLREIDLIRGGLVDRRDLPDTLPSRAAAYHLRGTINEQQEEDSRLLIVSVELLHAVSQRKIASTTLRVPPEKLSQELPEALHQLVNAIKYRSDVKSPRQQHAAKQNEVDELFYRSAADLYHFWRRKPRDFSHRDFRLSDLSIRHRTYGSRVPIDSPLGNALIRKSIDRLESVLYLQPERRDVMFALAWCLCNHIDGIWQPSRAQQLLENVVGANRNDALAREAINLQAEMYFHHRQGHCKPSDRMRAWENVFKAFKDMPEKFRDYEWSRFVQLLSMKFHVGPGTPEQTARLLRYIAPILEEDGGQQFQLLIYPATEMAKKLAESDTKSELQIEASELLRKWSASKHDLLRAEALRQLAMQTKEHDKAAELYLQVAEILSSNSTEMGVHRYQSVMLRAIARLRQAGKAEQALGLLDSFSPSRANHSSLLYGYHGFERGACLESLGRKQEALNTYVTYAEEDEGLVNNRQNIVDKIEKLGGVPLNLNRDIDVRYILDKKKSFPCQHISTAGQHLFLARHREGIVSYLPSDHSWQQLGGPRDGVTDLAVDGNLLWVGTREQGLWQYNLTTSKWKQWNQANGLPDDSVVDIFADQGAAYVSIGNRNSGGIVRIEADDSTSVYQDAGSPKACLYHLTADGHRLYGINKELHALNLATGKWQRLTDPHTGRFQHASFVHCDTSGLWGSHYGKELFLVNAKPNENRRFKKAWFPRGQGKAGYSVANATERDGKIWLCGSPWRRFRSVGLYRMDIETGDFTIYGPRDGFKTMSLCHKGVWLNDKLWLATSAGLASVTLRDPSKLGGE